MLERVFLFFLFTAFILFFQNCGVIGNEVHGSIDSVDLITIDNDLFPIDGGEKTPPSDSSDLLDGTQEKAQYICVTGENGQSERFGLEGEGPNGDAHLQTVCMSQVACEEIIGAHLAVTSIEKEGFCSGNNPHNRILSDLEISSLIQ